MRGKPKKIPRQKNLTDRYMDDDLDEDRIEQVQRFSDRSKHQQQNKTLKTTLMRAAEADAADPLELQRLPVGDVIQVYSVYCNVEHDGRIWMCVLRKTLSKVIGGDIVVGDRVRFRDLGATDESGQPEAVIEQLLPRATVLTRADSFKQATAHPIVANAEQMLIVASVHEPDVKWGLIDRMLVAARGGGLAAVICLNKMDLLDSDASSDKDPPAPLDALAHYANLGIRTVRTSISLPSGLDELREILKDRTTVLAGHSGVGKSSLIRAIEPQLDLRIGAISGYTGKGRHTTTSGQRFPLSFGGYVIDTPGVKLFGLWNVTLENLDEHFPDVANATAPKWRSDSHARIAASLTE